MRATVTFLTRMATLSVGEHNMKKCKGDVAWYLEGKKQPFAYSTRATSDLIAVLYEDYGDIRAVYDNITYDKDAKQI